MLFLALKQLKMSLAAALYAWLVLVPAGVLVEDTRLEIVIKNRQLEVNKVKRPQKVSQILISEWYHLIISRGTCPLYRELFLLDKHSYSVR